MKIPENAVKAVYDHLCKTTGSWVPISTDDIRDILTAAAPHMSGVKVKQLEWIEKNNDAYAHSKLGFYEINETRLGFCVYLNTFSVSKGVFETLEAAKTAAQADYEKRILSAIEPTAAREQPLPSELIRAYVEDYEWRTDSGDYTPNNTERAMIEDAIAGYAGYVDEVLASSAREQALDLSVLERLAKIADEYDEPDENGPFPDIQDAMISIRDLRQIRKLLAAILALKSQPAPQVGSK